MTILIWDKMDFKSNIVTRIKERHHLQIKGSISQEDITITKHESSKIYEANIKNWMKKQTFYNGRHFNTPTFNNGSNSWQKMNKEIEDLINIISQMNLIYIYRILHPITEEYIFFLRHTWNILHNTYYGQKVSKLKWLKYYQAFFTDYRRMNLEINSKRKTKKFTNMWKLNNTFLFFIYFY